MQTLPELYAALNATRDAYASATWEDIPGLQARQRDILGEIARQEHAQDADRCRRAGLPIPPPTYEPAPHATRAA